MLVGIGIDVVNLERFEAKLTDAVAERLFTGEELGRSLRSRAGIFAAKEAVIKAFGGIPGFSWRDIHVDVDVAGAPTVTLVGPVSDLAASRGVERIWVSITHDEPVAAATVVLEGRSA